MNNSHEFKKDVLMGVADGQKEYLKAPSWDCGWYWGFGYLSNKNIHHHIDSLNRNKNIFDALKEYYGDTITLGEKDLWTFCELIQTFYTLKETAEVLGRGGSHYTTNPLAETIKNEIEVKRINEILMPLIFTEISKLF